MADTLGYLYLASILCSAVMAFLFLKHLKGREMTILFPFLILTCIQEIALHLNGYYHFLDSTGLIYNIYRPISAIVFLYIYLRIPFMHSLKNLILGLGITYLAAILFTYCFIDGTIRENNSYLAMARGIVITFCAVLFLFSYLNLESLEKEQYWRPMIWITAGITIFYPVVTTTLSFSKYLAGIMIWDIRLHQLIPRVMSIFMYSCFGYAFYLCQKIK